ncbi:MAG: hypothetical protein ACREJU_00885, partial [Nitrospiraceae bacterium]
LGQSEASTPFRRIWFDGGSLQVVQEDRLTSAGAVEATVQFDDYRSVKNSPNGGSVRAGQTPIAAVLLKPFRITAQDGLGRGVIFLTFHEMVPNAPLTPDDLKLALDIRGGQDGHL